MLLQRWPSWQGVPPAHRVKLAPCAPLPRPLQPALDAAKAGRPKVSDRVALLKKALAADTVNASSAAGMGSLLDAAPSAEDQDAVSALFELSTSVC